MIFTKFGFKRILSYALCLSAFFSATTHMGFQIEVGYPAEMLPQGIQHYSVPANSDYTVYGMHQDYFYGDQLWLDAVLFKNGSYLAGGGNHDAVWLSATTSDAVEGDMLTYHMQVHAYLDKDDANSLAYEQYSEDYFVHIITGGPPQPDTTPPSTPSGLAPLVTGATAFSAAWNPSIDNREVAGYEVLLDGQSIGTMTEPWVSIEELQPGATYTLAVRACDAAGNWSAWSDSLTVTTLPAQTGTDPVMVVHILDGSKRPIAQQADGAANMRPDTGCYLRVAAYCPGGVDTIYANIDNADDWSGSGALSEEISCGGEIAVVVFGPYYVGRNLGPRPTWVHASGNGAGDFQWSGNGWSSLASWETPPNQCPYPNLIEPPPPLPAPPFYLTATAVSQTAIALEWTASMTGGASYELERKTGWYYSEEPFEKIADIAAGTTTHTDTGLMAGTTYTYRVRAKLGAQRSGANNGTTATTFAPPPPATPGNPAIGAVTSTSITLTWEGPVDSGVTYEIERSDDGTTFTKIADITGALAHTDTGLTSGATYHYRILARNNGGASDHTATLTATTTPSSQPPDAPASLTATATGQTTIALTWTASPTEGAAYELERKLGDADSEAAYTKIADIAAGSIAYTDTGNDNGLASATTYTYRLRAVKGGLYSDYISGENATATTKLTTPGDFTAEATAWNTISLTWTPVPETGATYALERRLATSESENEDDEDAFEQLGDAPLPANTADYTDTDLTAKTGYIYRLRAVLGDNTSDYAYTDPETVTTPPQPPPPPPEPPSALIATAASSNSITLTWTISLTEAASYELERKLGDAGSVAAYAKIATPAAGSIAYTDTGNDNGLASATTYTYRLRAVKGGLYSDYISGENATATTPLTTPTDLTATAASSSVINLSWTAVPETGAAYELERKTGAIAFAKIVDITDGSTLHADTGLAASTTYTYRLRTTLGAQTSAYSDEVSATTPAAPPPPPPTPGNPAIDTVTATAITLTWTGPTDASITYEIERSNDGITFTKIADITGALVHTDTGLTPGATYHYRILARNNGGTSAYAAVISATTKTLLAQPTHLQANLSALNTVILTWQNAADPDAHFEIGRDAGDGSHELIAVVGSGRARHVDGTVGASATYVYRVRAVLDGSVSDYSTVTVTTNPDPDAPVPALGLKLWLAPETLASTPSVNTWADQSGWANHAQAAEGIPSRTENGVNGHAYVFFDRSKRDWMQLPDVLGSASEGEAFIVVRADSNNRTLCLWNWASGPANGASMYPDDRGNLFEAFGGSVIRQLGEPIVDISGWHVYNVSVREGEFVARLNGVEQYRSSSAAVQFAAAPSIGKTSWSVFNGGMAEIVTYDRVLSAAERGNIGQYLAAKYGLAATGTPAAPSNVRAYAMSSTQAAVTWSGEGGAWGVYEIERSEDGGGSGGGFEKVGEVRALEGGWFLDEGLAGETKYTWRVRAVSFDGMAGYYGSSSPIIMPGTGAGFSPGGMRVWLRPDTLSGSGGLGYWPDASSSGHGAFSQSVNANFPTVSQNSLNGWPTVHFAKGIGSYTCVGAGQGEARVMENATEGEMFIVVRAAANATDNRLLDFGSSLARTYYPYTDANIREAFGVSGILIPSDDLPLTIWNVYNVSAKAGEWVVRLNGVEITRRAITACNFDYGLLRLGTSFDGDVAELIVYDRVLSEAERDNLTLRLYEKYDLADQEGQRPANLTASATGSHQIALSWDSVPGLDVTYVIERRAGVADFEQIGTSAKTAYFDGSVQPGIRYEYRVIDATQMARGLYSSPADATTSAAQPSGLPVSGGAPVLWLKTDNLKEGALDTWRDDSGGKNHATRPATSNDTNPPNVVLSQERGRMVVTFDPMKRQYFELGDVMKGATAGEIFAIVRATNAETDPGTAPRPLWGWSYSSGNGYPNKWFVNDDFGRINPYASTSFLATVARIDEWNLYSVSARTNEWIVRFNGLVQHLLPDFQVFFGERNTLGANWIGNEFFSGEIVEVIAFDRVLSTEERANLEQYLLNRHNIWGGQAPTIPAPDDLTGNAVAYSEIELKWGQDYRQIYPIQPVEVQRSEDGGVTWITIATCAPGVLGFTDTRANGLLPNKTYRYRLHVQNASRASGYGNVVTVDNIPVLADPIYPRVDVSESPALADYIMSWSLNSGSAFVPPIMGYNIYIDGNATPVFIAGATSRVSLAALGFADAKLEFGMHTLRIQTVHVDNLLSSIGPVLNVGRDPVRIPVDEISSEHDNETNSSSYKIIVYNDDKQPRKVTMRWLVFCMDAQGNTYTKPGCEEVIFEAGEPKYEIEGKADSYAKVSVVLLMPRLVLTNEAESRPSYIATPIKQAYWLAQEANKILYIQSALVRGWVESEFPVKLVVDEGADCVELLYQGASTADAWAPFDPENTTFTKGMQLAFRPKKPGKVRVHLAVGHYVSKDEEALWVEVPELTTTIVVLPRNLLQSVAFLPYTVAQGEAGGMLEVWHDDANVSKNPAADKRYDPPQWVDMDADGKADGVGERNLPVAYVRGSSPRLKAVFNIPGLEPGQMKKVRVRVARMVVPYNMVYEEPVNALDIEKIQGGGDYDAVGDTLNTPIFTLEHGIPSDTIRYYDKANDADGKPRMQNPAYKLAWSVDVGDGIWRNGGTSMHTVYVTLGMPVTGYRQETLFDISCRNAHGYSEKTDVRNYIYSKFRTLNVCRVGDGRQLTYWKNGLDPDAVETEELLSNSNGNGNCESWAALFRDMLRLHGISAQRIIINHNIDSYIMLVKNWKFDGVGLSGDSEFPYIIGRDVKEIDGISAQGNEKPPKAFFVHWITQSDDIFFDPSYGTEPIKEANDVARLKRYGDGALDGFAKSVTPDEKTFYAKKRDTLDIIDKDKLIITGAR
jgi:fibronectin type 3 domain-containing protein